MRQLSSGLSRSVRSAVAALALAICLLAAPGVASAASSCDPAVVDKTWTGAVSSSWFAAGNWSPSGVPTSSSDVCIPASSANDPAVDTGSVANAASIESFRPITVSAGTLRIASTSQPSDLHHDLRLTGGNLNNLGTLRIAGTLDWTNGGTIQGAGTTTVAAGGNLSLGSEVGSQILDKQTLRVNGTGTAPGVTNYSQTGFQNGATLEVGGSLSLGDNQFFYKADSSASQVHVLSGGSLAKSTGAGSADIGVPLDNDGAVGAAAGTLALSGLAPVGLASSGVFAPDSGATVDFTSGTQRIGEGGRFGGAGTTRVSGATLFLTGNTSGGADSTLQLASGSLVTNTGTLTLDGTLDWDYGTIQGAGTTTVAADGNLSLGSEVGSLILDAQTLRVNGTGTAPGVTNYSQTGFQNGATLEVGGSLSLGDNQFFYKADSSASQVHVLSGGSLAKSTGAGSADIGVPLDNGGKVEVSAGILNSSNAFANYNQSTDVLTGGEYVVRDGARFGFVGADVRTLQAEVALDGPGSRLQDESAQDGTRNLHTIGDQGKLRLRNDRNFTRTGAFTNNGVLELDETTTFNATTNYVQGASGTYRTEIAGTGPGTSYGQLTAGGTANLAGTLTVIATYVPQTGDFFDVVVAGSSRSGTFSTVNATGFAVKYLSDRVRLTAPELRISDRTVTEGNSGSVTAKFRVDLSSPSAGTTTVNYQTADGSAKAPGDYATTTGTLTFAPGDTTEFADVPVNGDTIDENNETYRVTLSNPTGAEIIDDTGTGRITDDDAAPTVSVADAPNRPEGGSAHSFQVSLSSASGKQVKVNYATANGTASAPGDYTAKSGTLTFAAGQTTKTVTVRNAQDALDENDETFTLALSNPVNATVADGSGQTSILDDDVAPSLAISDSLSQTEGGPSHSFQVTLSAPSGRTVTVAYATEDGSAQAPGDYTAKSDTLTFSPGETTKTVLVASSQDSLDEASETFTVKLSSPVNATVSDGSGQGTITDDDPTPTLSISDGTNRFEGGPPHTFTITLSAPSGQQVTVDYATQDGTATAPGDYTAKSGTLTFLPGQTSKSVSVQNVNDALDEPNEMFTVALSNPLNATVADGSGATTILDND